MVTRLNEAFSDAEHRALTSRKEETRKKLKRKTLSWHDYILHMAGVENE